MLNVNSLLKSASKITSLPVVNLLSGGANRSHTAEEIEAYLVGQRLARDAVKEIASMMRPGWSEQRAADLINTYLRDHGVKSFFHKAFVWYGERTRFDGVKNYFDFLPGKRVLREDEVYILDVAPIVNGYICDIGYSECFGENKEFEKARAYLCDLREEIPQIFSEGKSGAEVWNAIDENIRDRGYENIHKMYPFSVLGHRVHKSRIEGVKANFINFGWQSYWEFTSRGIFGQLLNQNFEGDLSGLWAIEPHFATQEFGAKFEEILLVQDGKAHWIEKDGVGLLSVK